MASCDSVDNCPAGDLLIAAGFQQGGETPRPALSQAPQIQELGSSSEHASQNSNAGGVVAAAAAATLREDALGAQEQRESQRESVLR